MVDYHDEAMLPFPRQRIWQLIEAHRDPAQIGRIHPLVRNQEVESTRADETVVLRTIDVRGELRRSTWRLTSQPPEMFRWEILESDGPWAEGTWLENRYSEVPGGTRIESRGKLKVSVIPFLIPQGPVIRRVLSDLDVEDAAYLKG
ncbi:MAG TPA: hypothetical protein VMI55_04105 [Thermoplasmata archaeon]|nr:hypothetical protein [Thermoplasmata archaeon]